MLKIKDTIRVSPARPSQWQARTNNDEPVVIRYREGVLSVLVGPSGVSGGGTEENLQRDYNRYFHGPVENIDLEYITISKACSAANLLIEGQVSRWPGSPDYDPERREFIFDRRK